MSPSQASETCASASSATSASTGESHYANAFRGCQERLPPAPITVGITVAATTGNSVKVSVAVAVSATTPPDAIRRRHIASRSAPVPTTIARVVTVYKLGTLLIGV